MNTKALLELADVIERADRFDLSTPCGNADKAKRPAFADCDLHVGPASLWKGKDMVGCVAGWACAWSDAEAEVWEDYTHVKEWATMVLDLTDEQAENLFCSAKGSAWVEVYGPPRPYTAKEAAGLLRLAAAGEVKALL